MNPELLYHTYKHTLPAAFALLPGRMNTLQARAMLLAIALQESRFFWRIQHPNGPAHGFWQFERAGAVRGVILHVSTSPILIPILHTLRYENNAVACYNAITHNDVLACIFARLLLWTVPGRLPERYQYDYAWDYYIKGWRPGKPHRETWNEFYDEAWRTVTEE